MTKPTKPSPVPSEPRCLQRLVRRILGPRYVVKKKYDIHYPDYFRYDIFDRHLLQRCVIQTFLDEQSARERAEYLNQPNTKLRNAVTPNLNPSQNDNSK